MPITTTATTVSRRMQVKRKYGSRHNLNTSPVSSPEKTSGEVQAGQKRPLTSSFYNNVPTPMTKRTKHSVKSNSKSLKKTKQNRKILTQLHFAIDRTTLWTCPLCDLSYTKGAIEDESLHRSHCARVQRGMEWGKEEERESVKIGVVEIVNQVEITGGRRGRIISCPAECIGKIGSKVREWMSFGVCLQQANDNDFYRYLHCYKLLIYPYRHHHLHKNVCETQKSIFSCFHTLPLLQIVTGRRLSDV